MCRLLTASFPPCRGLLKTCTSPSTQYPSRRPQPAQKVPSARKSVAESPRTRTSQTPGAPSPPPGSTTPSPAATDPASPSSPEISSYSPLSTDADLVILSEAKDLNHYVLARNRPPVCLEPSTLHCTPCTRFHFSTLSLFHSLRLHPCTLRPFHRNPLQSPLSPLSRASPR